MSMKEATSHPPSGFVVVWKSVRDHLDRVRLALHTQIHDYPRPVAGCDQQFNYLLEKRQAISAELRRLDALRHAKDGGADAIRELECFIEGSAFLDDAARQRLRAGLLAPVS